ncbi:MAG TPA: hypothetical protein VFN10_07665 [Thermoanaerobaculia bacterium]|nr:hypothetical protein [Thermoanaerobaculia bacterium]
MPTSRFIFFFAALFLAITTEAATLSTTPVRTIPVRRWFAQSAPYAFDGTYEFIGTSDGLWRSVRISDPAQPLERVAFPGEQILALAVHGGKLYVGKAPTLNATNTEHTFVVTDDHGATFTPRDAGLRDCSLDCGYILVNSVEFDDERLFIEAGGNLLVSHDDGVTWKNLFPTDRTTPAVRNCPLQFEIVANRALVGGECPLDVGWIGAGVLAAGDHEWTTEPRRLNVPGMQNRNVQFIALQRGSIFAAVEGGLLRSDDLGESYRWVSRFDFSSSQYPYMKQFVASTADPHVMLAGGFDKPHDVLYAMLSTDGGEHWQDVSRFLSPTLHSSVYLLAEDRDGHLLAGVQREDRLELFTIDVVPATMRRRAAGH